MTRKVIFTPNAPKPIGPYSQAVQANGVLFISGQVPLDPETGQVILSSIREQTRKVLENIKAVIEAANSNLSAIVKTTIFLKSLDSFDEVNQIYSEYFGEIKPARTTVEVSRLPKGVDIEIDAIAVLEKS
jgi:2-iminobutanoate/2-iminopropanoate deaminase